MWKDQCPKQMWLLKVVEDLQRGAPGPRLSLQRGLDSPEHGRQGRDRWGRPVSVRNRSHKEENKPQPANTPLCFGN